MRKHKRHYKTGIHNSIKCKEPIAFRSGWEEIVCQFFDLSDEVLCYSYEKIKIKYISNKRTGKIRTYYPDFFVMLKNGDKILVEVKRRDKLNDSKVIKKTEAAMHWARKKKVKFQIWTDEIIQLLKNQLLVKKTVLLLDSISVQPVPEFVESTETVKQPSSFQLNLKKKQTYTKKQTSLLKESKKK